jgi:N4-gp56 family major capsid protein
VAETYFGTNAAQTVKRWSRLLWRESIHKMWASRLMGTGPNAVVQRLTDLEANAGDEIKWDLLLQMSQYGVVGDNEISGMEEELTYVQDAIKIDQRRIAHAFRRMSSQRTLHDLRADARSNLSDRYAVIDDEILFAYLAGTAGDNAALAAELAGAGFAGNVLLDPVSTGGTPDADRCIEDGATAFTTDMVDIAYERATTITPLIRPATVDGQEVFIMIVHPYCITDLRIATGGNLWREITAMAGVRGSQNPLVTRATGMWGNVLIHESPRIPRTSTVAHSLFLGAQAGAVATGNAYAKPKQTQYGTQNMMSWSEEEKDHGNRMSVAAGKVYGIKKASFDYDDGSGYEKAFGVIRYDMLAAQHS